MHKRWITLLLILLLPLSVYTQTAKYSNAFLSIGIGAKSFGMANATVAHIDGVTSGYWNPAGLSRLDKQYELGIMHAEYFTGIAKYDYLGGAMKIDSSQHIGASLIRFGVDDIPNTTELIDKQGNIDYDRISYFSAADYAFILSYARKSAVQNLTYGGNAKIIHRTIGSFAKAWGFGLDVGLQYSMNQWQFGAMARDITTTFNAWNYNAESLAIEVRDSAFNLAPDNNIELTLPELTLGAAYQISLPNKFEGLMEMNLNMLTGGKYHTLLTSGVLSMEPRWGMEFSYDQILFLRFGIGNFQRVPGMDGNENLSYQPNIGLGIQYKGIALDYALTDLGDQSAALYSNIFTLRYAFDGNHTKSHR